MYVNRKETEFGKKSSQESFAQVSPCKKQSVGQDDTETTGAKPILGPNYMVSYIYICYHTVRLKTGLAPVIGTKTSIYQVFLFSDWSRAGCCRGLHVLVNHLHRKILKLFHLLLSMNYSTWY